MNEARKSGNSFESATIEDQYVIYNFEVTFTGAIGSAFEQAYMFPPEVNYRTLEADLFANGKYPCFICFAFT